MKTSKKIIFILLSIFFFSYQFFAQDRPAYLTVTTTHWNMEKTDGSPEEWLALEKEYFEKVTMKNEYIFATQWLNHFYTADNSEIVLVSAYASWEDIVKAQDRTQELVETAWPDEDARKAYFKKKDDYYVNKHTDEIYHVLPNVKFPVPDTSKDDQSMIYFVQKRHLAFPEEGSADEMGKLHKEFLENVTYKNKYVKGYFEYRHAWGSDNLEFVQVRVVNSLSDLESSNSETGKLVNAYWPDVEKRDAFFDSYNKYFSNWHGDWLYRNVPELWKKPNSTQK